MAFGRQWGSSVVYEFGVAGGAFLWTEHGLVELLTSLLLCRGHSKVEWILHSEGRIRRQFWLWNFLYPHCVNLTYGNVAVEP